MLNSLSATYNTLNSDLPRHLDTVTGDIEQIHRDAPSVTSYPHQFSLALTICNFLILLAFYCICLHWSSRTFTGGQVIHRMIQTAN